MNQIFITPPKEKQYTAVASLFDYAKKCKEQGTETPKTIDSIIRIANELNIIFKRKI